MVGAPEARIRRLAAACDFQRPRSAAAPAPEATAPHSAVQRRAGLPVVRIRTRGLELSRPSAPGVVKKQQYGLDTVAVKPQNAKPVHDGRQFSAHRTKGLHKFRVNPKIRLNP